MCTEMSKLVYQRLAPAKDYWLLAAGICQKFKKVREKETLSLSKSQDTSHLVRRKQTFEICFEISFSIFLFVLEQTQTFPGQVDSISGSILNESST